MASSSEMLHYKDLTPAPRLDNKTLNKMVWRSCQLQACFNYERMQSVGWLWSMLPGLQKIHTNKEDLAASMTHNLDFLNTHPVRRYIRNGYGAVHGTAENGHSDDSFRTYLCCRSVRRYR